MANCGCDGFDVGRVWDGFGVFGVCGDIGLCGCGGVGLYGYLPHPFCRE